MYLDYQTIYIQNQKETFYLHHMNHHDLVNHYGISVLQMITYMFRLPKSKSCPFLIYDQPLILSKSIATGTNSSEGTAYPSGAPTITPVLSVVHVAQFSVYYYVDHCLSRAWWPFNRLSFCTIRLFVAPLTDSNISFSFQRKLFVKNVGIQIYLSETLWQNVFKFGYCVY